MIKHLIIGLLGILRLLTDADARPEYATKEKISCMTCHVNAWGGGPRTVFGKNYGSHTHAPAKLSAYDWVYADLRAIAYYPVENTAARGNGVSLMQASVTGNAPLHKSENNAESRAVLTYNIAPLSQSHVREAYVRFGLAAQDPGSATVFQVGRFYMPFGLLTDEHRTYTRIQTNSTINNYNLGASVSGTLLKDISFDFVAVNDLQSTGTFKVGDITWATVANIRWNPKSLPFLLGASGNYQQTITSRDPYASSVYGVLSLGRITENRVDVTLSIERVDAWGWNHPNVNTGGINPSLLQFFVPESSSAIRSAVTDAHSVGYYGLARYYFKNHWNLFYKFDYLDINGSRDGGRFTRHGVGMEAFVHSNISINARYEKGFVGFSEVEGTSVLSAHDDFFAMFRLWI